MRLAGAAAAAARGADDHLGRQINRPAVFGVEDGVGCAKRWQIHAEIGIWCAPDCDLRSHDVLFGHHFLMVNQSAIELFFHCFCTFG